MVVRQRRVDVVEVDIIDKVRVVVVHVAAVSGTSTSTLKVHQHSYSERDCTPKCGLAVEITTATPLIIHIAHSSHFR